MVREWIVPYTIVHCRVWISCSLCPEFPDCPVILVFAVEKLDQRIEGVTVSSFRVCFARTGGCDDYIEEYERIASRQPAWSTAIIMPYQKQDGMKELVELLLSVT